MTNTIDSNLFISSLQNKSKTESSNTLGQDAFLKLLITQLQYQDPLNPMEDTQFISQMATFTSLEQMMGIKDSLDSVVSLQKENQLVAYNQFVGKEVTWHQMENSGDEDILVKEGTGKIVSIKFGESGPLFYLEDGTELKPENISFLNEETNDSSIVQASNLIGKSVSWENTEGIMETAIVTSVIQKNGQITYQLNDSNNTKLTAEQIVRVESIEA
ncbi:flagellar hook assembly protein FlgD [Caldibacillus lycopersici]|uniref:Basal-body rod modification protein FlgD n=1 Tax=Perspicuibacillus lycopersici TaxID=1325689 RepID=A0AAE3LL94_9BACI|nr:flagellar hook assembly protein FlgD [Perspicuibacillus lycopersici]MCU9612100.1 flagellar hook assembly protein FlgD [Perspicuibacillus lycopersici]